MQRGEKVEPLRDAVVAFGVKRAPERVKWILAYIKARKSAKIASFHWRLKLMLDPVSNISNNPSSGSLPPFCPTSTLLLRNLCYLS
jgi:hypothetical protein